MNTQIYQVLGKKYPFGRGKLGSATINSDPHTRRTCSGTAGTPTLSISSGAYANGDLIAIVQTTNNATSITPNWELNYIVSGGGTTTLTLLNNLGRNYSSGAQVMDVMEYVNLTINAMSPTSWNDSLGGYLFLAVRGALTTGGALSAYGNLASSPQTGNWHLDGMPNPAGGVGCGFRGGAADEANNDGTATSGQGQSMTNLGSWSYLKNGMGAGGGHYSGAPGETSGGGAGYADAGNNGTHWGNPNNTSGEGGEAGSTADLTCLPLGAGGGGGCKEPDYRGGGGGAGAGSAAIWAKILTITNAWNFYGGDGAPAPGAAPGGAGSGGGLLLNVFQVTGLANINCRGGTGGAGQEQGGDGSKGRVRVNYFYSYSGVPTNASFSAVKDTMLREPSPAAQIIL